MQFGAPYGAPQTPWGAPPPAYNPYAPQPWGSPPQPSRESETEKLVKELAAQLEASKREQLAMKYEQDLERQRVESQKQLEALSAEIRRSTEQGSSKDNDEVRREREARERMEREMERKEINAKFEALQLSIAQIAQAKGRPDDEAIRELKEENRRRDEEHKRELDKRDQQAREERLRLEMKESQEKTERLVREMSQHKGPDPMLEFMKESARENRQTQERIATISAQQAAALQSQAINPMQLLTILKDRDNSGDQFIRQIMPAMITGSDMESYDRGYYRVPKRDLIVGLQVTIQKGGLQIAEGMREVAALVKEMCICPSPCAGHPRNGAWPVNIAGVSQDGIDL
jgi:hypothetical protein